ncbi:hypothetical protein Slin15195_G117220 [Septoria linicola]|uniref:Uncharacterized protein n=1 Tax=Septoria linicola TaxID=215465 RepID=A0A9Q9B3R8_9PEZI|nr:hypothetical protein Slin14017_G094220 [Septoria linicola]USW58403.1 hypothetical protein Slin15195_G117220 [Septoria linicola]
MHWNWLKHDPWFPLRSLVHTGHPTSPLSTPELVQGAFFSTKYESSSIVEFMRWMPCYESMMWPIAMFGSFANWLRGENSWLEAPVILQSVECSRSVDDRDPVCIILGLEDIMFDQGVTTRIARDYREALAELDRFSKNASINSVHVDTDFDGISTESRGRVRVVLLMGSGHHVQNDVQTEVAAGALLTWVNQV